MNILQIKFLSKRMIYKGLNKVSQQFKVFVFITNFSYKQIVDLITTREPLNRHAVTDV